jgi:hypothetical protein
MTERATFPKRLPRWVYGGAFGCAVILAWLAWHKYRPASAEEVAQLAKKVGGEDVLKVIENAQRVYATRIQIKRQKQDWESLDDFEAISEPVLVGASDRDELKRLLTSPRNYELPGLPAACLPRWGFRLRFVTATDAMNVWVCLECDHMMFLRDGKNGGGGANFDPMEHQINALAIRLFPGDDAIAEAVK